MSDLTNQQILERITAVIGDSAPTPELEAHLRAVYEDAGAYTLITQFGVEILAGAALFVDDVMVERKDLQRAALFRVAANCLVNTAAMVVRAAKRIEGAELDPAKFALVCFSIAHGIAEQPWKPHEKELLHNEPGDLRATFEAQHADARMKMQATIDELSATCAQLHERLATVSEESRRLEQERDSFRVTAHQFNAAITILQARCRKATGMFGCLLDVYSQFMSPADVRDIKDLIAALVVPQS